MRPGQNDAHGVGQHAPRTTMFRKISDKLRDLGESIRQDVSARVLDAAGIERGPGSAVILRVPARTTERAELAPDSLVSHLRGLLLRLESLGALSPSWLSLRLDPDSIWRHDERGVLLTMDAPGPRLLGELGPLLAELGWAAIAFVDGHPSARALSDDELAGLASVGIMPGLLLPGGERGPFPDRATIDAFRASSGTPTLWAAADRREPVRVRTRLVARCADVGIARVLGVRPGLAPPQPAGDIAPRLDVTTLDRDGITAWFQRDEAAIARLLAKTEPRRWGTTALKRVLEEDER